MGTWGAGLYEDDQASDLKNTIALLSKVPAQGERLLQILEKNWGSCDPDDDDGRLFWLVVADQFERRGIDCPRVPATALSIIASGVDLESAKDKGADHKFLKQRALALEELRKRLITPRPIKPHKKAGKAPGAVLNIGEVYAFPAMNGIAWSPHRLPYLPPFEPNEWGAMVVLATGRAFDWLPWCALASLTVDPAVKPTLADVLGARLITHFQTNGAGIFVPKKAHAKGLGMELLGHIKLDPALVKPTLSKWGIETAVQMDWTISYGAYSASCKGLPIGCELASLIVEEA